LNVLKEKELKDIQEEYREVDSEFRALGVMVEKDALMDGRPNQANQTTNLTQLELKMMIYLTRFRKHKKIL